MRILIVDDEQEVCDVFRRKLLRRGYTKERGHRIDLAEDGATCLTLASATPAPDVIFMDGNLARETGPAVVRTLRAAGCTAKIVMMSGDEKLNAEGVTAGADLGRVKVGIDSHFETILTEFGFTP